MDIYKKAIRQGLRLQTTQGLLSVEQLWSAKTATLITLEEGLQDEVAKFSGTSRRRGAVKDSVQETAVLSLAIVSDILDTKEREAEDKRSAAEIKEFNQEIDALILEKTKDARKGLSIEELQKLRK